MPDPTEQKLADWKAKTDAATEGPWEAFEQDDAFAIEARAEDDFGFFVAEPPLYQPDVEFIAVSRTAMPRLLTAVESVLAIEPWPSNPNMQSYELDEAQGYNEALTEIRRAITEALGGGDDAE